MKKYIKPEIDCMELIEDSIIATSENAPKVTLSLTDTTEEMDSKKIDFSDEESIW